MYVNCRREQNTSGPWPASQHVLKICQVIIPTLNEYHLSYFRFSHGVYAFNRDIRKICNGRLVRIKFMAMS